MSASLTVPAPVLKFANVGGGVAAMEEPFNVRFAAVTRAGMPIAPPELTVFGLAIRRRLAAGAPAQVWDDGTKSWVPDKPGQPSTPLALAYDAVEAEPWRGMFVVAGMKDASGAAAFGSVSAGYPTYSVRGVFGMPGGPASFSPESPMFTFVSVAERSLILLGHGDGEKAENATILRAQLRNGSRQVIGGLRVLRNSPGAEVRLENAAGAAVVLLPDGSIELRPASGRGVVVAADLETERITYRPSGAGAKKVLD